MSTIHSQNRDKFLLGVFFNTASIKEEARVLLRRLQKMGASGKWAWNVRCYPTPESALEPLAGLYAGLIGSQSFEETYFYKIIKRFGEEDRARAKAKYEATSRGGRNKYGRPGISGYIESDKFYTIRKTQNGIAILIGEKKVLDKWTGGWKKKYWGKAKKELWFRNKLPYYLTGNYFKGYWWWQEYGAGPPEHWLKATVAKVAKRFQRMYPKGSEGYTQDNWDKYRDAALSRIGGNIKARHIFLMGHGTAHTQQKVLVRQALAQFRADFPAFLNSLRKFRARGK